MTLDRPLLFLGLEIDELVIMVGLGGLLLFLAGPLSIGVTGGAWFALARARRGRPPGHLAVLLYRWRLLPWLPLGPSHLPYPDWDRSGRQCFSAVSAEADRRSPHARFYWRLP